MSDHLPILGYVLCHQCGASVRDEVAFKTQGLCAPCFRDRANETISAAMVVVSGREKIVLRSKRSPAELEQRARARRRKRAQGDATATGIQCTERARRRLAKLFPELLEVLIADERAKAGLNAWTIDRTLTPGEASKSLEFLKTYHALEEAPT
jgi:hypothetical protein